MMQHDHNDREPGIASYDREDRADDALDLLPIPVPVQVAETPPPRPRKPREPQRTWRQPLGTTYTRGAAKTLLLSGIPASSRSLWIGWSSSDDLSRIELEITESRGGAPSRTVRVSLSAGEALCLDTESAGGGMNISVIAVSAAGTAWACASDDRRAPDAPTDGYWFEEVANGLRGVPPRAVAVMPTADLAQWSWGIRDGDGTAQTFSKALTAGTEAPVEAPLFNSNAAAKLRWQIRL